MTKVCRISAKVQCLFFQDDPSSPSVPDAGLDNYNVSFALAKSLPKSKNLVLFLHGGGFVSLTSKSYEVNFCLVILMGSRIL